MLEKVINKVPKTWWFSRPFGKNEKKCCRYHCRLHLTNDQDQQEGKMWSGVQDLHRKDSSQPAQPQITAPAPPLHNKYEKRCPCEVRIRRGKGLRSTVHLFSWTLKLVWRWETTLCDTEHYCYCRCPLHYIFQSYAVFQSDVRNYFCAISGKHLQLEIGFLQMGHYHSKECLDRGDGKECLYVFYNNLCTGISRWRVNATSGNFNSHRNTCICFQCLKRHLISSWQHVSSFVNLQFHKFTKIGPITYNQYLTSYRPKWWSITQLIKGKPNRFESIFPIRFR